VRPAYTSLERLSLIVCRLIVSTFVPIGLIGKRTQQDIKSRFGAAVKKRRYEINLSQEALAERAGLHRTYVADIERGARNLALENIEKLAVALEISISDLFAKYGVNTE
jgi:ribosome-binding protein aMBF1 (putative translation factor)